MNPNPKQPPRRGRNDGTAEKLHRRGRTVNATLHPGRLREYTPVPQGRRSKSNVESMWHRLYTPGNLPSPGGNSVKIIFPLIPSSRFHMRSEEMGHPNTGDPEAQLCAFVLVKVDVVLGGASCTSAVKVGFVCDGYSTGCLMYFHGVRTRG